MNIGDQLMWWSDDRLKSTFHRVRAPRPDEYQGSRYSIGYFTVPNGSTVIQVQISSRLSKNTQLSVLVN